MARARSNPRRFGSNRSARLTEWSSLVDAASVVVATTGSSIVSSTSFEDPGTLIRSRGLVTLELPSYAADALVFGAFGAGIVSAEALAVGITAVPHPYRDADWGGWMIWQAIGMRFEFNDATGTFLASWNYDVDSKAMRKVGPNEAWVFVAESQSGAFSIHESVRLLLKLA